MAEGPYSVALFFSTNYAVWASKLFRKHALEEKLTSVPRHLSSDCGYCVRIRTCDTEKAETLMKDSGIEFDRMEKL